MESSARSSPVASIMRFLVLSVVSAGLVVACGHDVPSRLAGVVESAKTPTRIMVFGGNRSCKPDGHNELSPLTTDLARNITGIIDSVRASGKDLEIMLACFTGPGEVLLSYNFSHELETETPEGLVARAVKYSDPDSRLILIGHSYGGWTAMTVAEQVARKSTRSESVVAGLVTIDPISRKNCTYTSWNNCVTAPADFTEERLEFLRYASKYWANFFQRKTPWLHSSRISQAHFNKELDATHFNIDMHQHLWRHVELLLHDRLTP